MSFDTMNPKFEKKTFYIRMDVSDPDKKVFTYSVPTQSKIIAMIHNEEDCILEFIFNLPDFKKNKLVLQRRVFFIEGEMDVGDVFPQESVWGPFSFLAHGEKKVVT